MPDIKIYTLHLDQLDCVRVTTGPSEIDYVSMQVMLDDVTNERLPNQGFREMTLGSVWPLQEIEGLEFHKAAQVTLYVEKKSGRLEIGRFTFYGGQLPPRPIPFERDGGEYLLTATVT